MATVITNLMSAIPYIGQDIVEFIWGGPSVGNPTLQRFFALHYLLPFVLAALTLMHLIALHEHGSSNPLGITGNIDRLPFSPYFIFKDLITVFVFLLIYSSFVFFNPNTLGQGWPLTIIIILFMHYAICWKDSIYKLLYNNILILNITINISDLTNIFRYYTKYIVLYANPNIVKSYLKEFNQQITKYKQFMFNKVGISETTRIYKIFDHLLYIKNSIIQYKNILIKDLIVPTEEISNNTSKDNQERFNQWLAGLIDGDGYFGITKNKYTSCEITVGLEDEKMLNQIQNKFGGSVKLRSGIRAVRYRLQNKEDMINLINAVNGNIRNTKRYSQLIKVCDILNIKIKNPIELTSDNAWFSGFFDADGTINYFYRDKDNKLKIKPQLIVSVTNKLLVDVEPYYKIFGGNIYFDKSQNGYYKWTIANEKLHLKYYEYNKINPSRSFKGRRIFLIKEFYEYYNKQAFRSPSDSLLFKAWNIFDQKWNNKNF